MRRFNSDPDISRGRRRSAEAAGRRAETLAVWYLRMKLFSPIARRAKTPGGEIDIIARRGNLVIFVEVKMRRSRQALDEALQAVNRQRIIRAAEFFVAMNPGLENKTLRFDVILLAPFSLPVHIRGAFDTGPGTLI